MNFIYITAKRLLGQHLTLDESVDKSVGCAQALSYVLKASGYSVPKKGIPGTVGIKAWCDKNAIPLNGPQVGAIIVSVTEGDRHGHVGVCARYDFMYPDDFGIMSNDSRTGLWEVNWSLEEWKIYYEYKLGLQTFFYKLEI
jgi:hypothetical protein